jgi:uncharacterized protein YjcR
MAGTNNGKSKDNSKDDWTEKIREEAKKLYERGAELLAISEQLGVPLELLATWSFTGQWDVLPDTLVIGDDAFPSAIEKIETKNSSYNDSIYNITSADISQEANDKLLEGYKLVGNVAQEALLNDNVKFKDKKQASDALLESLKGQVSLLGTDLSQQFILDVAKIIRDEITDQEILQRLGVKLTALGRLYNTRISA